jgi:hypothetical protein
MAFIPTNCAIDFLRRLQKAEDQNGRELPLVEPPPGIPASS